MPGSRDRPVHVLHAIHIHVFKQLLEVLESIRNGEIMREQMPWLIQCYHREAGCTVSFYILNE